MRLYFLSTIVLPVVLSAQIYDNKNVAFQDFYSMVEYAHQFNKNVFIEDFTGID